MTSITLRRKQGKLLAKFLIQWRCLALDINSTQSGRELLYWVGVKRFWLIVGWDLQSRNPFLIYVYVRVCVYICREGTDSVTYIIFWTPKLQKKNTYFMSRDIDWRRGFRLISEGAQARHAARKALLNEQSSTANPHTVLPTYCFILRDQLVVNEMPPGFDLVMKGWWTSRSNDAKHLRNPVKCQALIVPH